MKISRRSFLKAAGICCAAGHVRGESAGRPVRLGGPLFFSEDDPDLWARHARELGYGAVYAPACRLDDRSRIEAIRKACAENDLIIAEVGRWVNMLDSRPGESEKNLKTVTEGLALADELGAKCCVDIAGSFAESPWYGPDPKNLTEEFFERAVENARKIIDAVKPKRAKFAYEITGWGNPTDTDSYLRMIGAIGRDEFGVHLDVCNMVNSPQKFWNTTEMIRDAFKRLGPKMVSSHAKDLRWEVEMNIHFVECVAGEGKVDLAAILRGLADLPHDVPFMIEHMNSEEEYTRSRENLKKIAAENGIPVF